MLVVTIISLSDMNAIHVKLPNLPVEVDLQLAAQSHLTLTKDPQVVDMDKVVDIKEEVR